MKTNAPKLITWLIGVIVGVLGILGTLTSIPVVSANSFVFLTAGFVLLAVASVVKGL